MARPVDAGGGKGSRFIILASVCVVIAGLYFGREVFVPLALAVLLSFLLTPAVRWLERLHFPRAAASLVVVAIAVGVVGAIGYVVYKQFVAVIDQLPAYEGELKAKLHALGSRGGVFSKAEVELRNLGGPAASQPAGRTAAAPPRSNTASAQGPTTQPMPVTIVENRNWIQRLREYAATIFDPLVTAGLVLVFIIFMLINREDLRDRMIRLVGHGRLNITTQALDEAGTRISRYLGSLAIVNTLYGLVTASGLWTIGYFLGHGQGFPNVLVWGILVGVWRFVPYVGVWIGASIPILLSFALFTGNAAFFATLGLFITLEILVSQFIEPIWYGASTGMTALAVLVSVVFWSWLWGPVGLLLSTPLTVCLLVIGKHVPQLQFLDIMLGDEPVLPPHVRLYQRLIASDEEEASELAHEMLKEKSLDQVFDQLLIPALALAEQDHHRGLLEEDRRRFVRQSMRGLVEELGDEQRASNIRDAAAHTEKLAKEEVPDVPRPVLRAAVPEECNITVLCIPARDESDEIVAMMLAQVLELRGYCAISASVTSLVSELLDLVEKHHAQITCISAMPPSAVAHARYICKRMHARFPEMTMAVGLWLTKYELPRARRRLGCDESAPVVTTLAAALHEIDQLAQPIIVRRTSNERAPIGATAMHPSSSS